MKNLKFFFAFTLLVVLAALALAGCAGVVQTAKDAGIGSPDDFVKAYGDIAKGEIQLSNGFVPIFIKRDAKISGLIAANQVASQCFTNSDQVLTDFQAARFQTPQGGVDVNAMVNAYVINEAYVGDITECQRQKTQIVSGLVGVYDEYASDMTRLYDQKSTLETMESGTLASTIAFDVMTRYAKDFEDKFYAGIPVSDMLFPTYHVQAPTKSKALCDYYNDNYNNGHYGDGKTVGRCDWNEAMGQGTLYGKAAWDYIFMIRLSSATQNTLDNGVNEPINMDTPVPTVAP